MHKELIITVAGSNERFKASLGKDVHKCIYYEGNPEGTLLARMVKSHDAFDRIIIVGGYRYNDICEYIDKHLSDYGDIIKTVYNEKFAKYGSGYSLYLGLEESLQATPDTVVFAEGDLFVDEESFNSVCNSDKSVITYNRDAITAGRSVAVYTDIRQRLHYLYDTGHQNLYIPEPFTGIYNSGQVWKFTDINRLRSIVESLHSGEKQGTNLVIIQKYFGDMVPEEYGSICFEKWINCNTISDYRLAKEEMVWS